MEGKENSKFEQFFSDRRAVTEDLMIFDTDGIPSLLYIIIIITQIYSRLLVIRWRYSVYSISQ